MIINPNRDTPITRQDGVPMQRFIGWMEEVTKLLNTLEPVYGTGSPEGVLKAPRKSYFFDESTNKLYFKTSDVSLDTGWIALT